MTLRPRTYEITVSLSATDYGVYRAAVRILRRAMRAEAPDVPTLIQSKLHRQDATGLAEDYLDLVAWPHADRLSMPRKRVAQPGHRLLRVRGVRLVASKSLQSVLGGKPACADPSRN